MSELSSGSSGWSRRRILAGAAASTIALAGSHTQAEQGAPAPGLRRGIGLHQLLNWPDTTGNGASLQYSWPPFAAANYQIAPAELKGLRSAGFDFVRLTVDPSIFIVTEADRRPVLETHAVTLVRRLIDAGLSVVFDLHPVAVNPAYTPEALVDPATPELFNAYLAMVGRIAAMLHGLPPERVVIEPFNEPPIAQLTATPRWQAMLERLHGAIRAVDPVRPVVLNGLQWDSLDALVALDVRPFRGSNVFYTFHYYDPHAFTHQSVQPDTKWLSGLRWPSDDANVHVVEARARTAIAADARLSPADRKAAEGHTRYYITEMLGGHAASAQIARDFDTVARWAKTNAIAPERVLLGEFGCADVASAPEDRLAWLTAVRSASEGAGFGWAYWAYKGNSGMTLIKDGGTMDPATLRALGLIPDPRH